MTARSNELQRLEAMSFRAATSEIGVSRGNRAITLVLQFVLAFVLCFAAGMKLLSGPASTQLTLLSIGVQDPSMIVGFSIALPLIELLLAVWLAIGSWPRAAAAAAVALFVMFTCVLFLVGASSGWSAPCNCTGTIIGESVAVGIIRNALLIAAAIWLTQRLATPSGARGSSGR